MKVTINADDRNLSVTEIFLCGESGRGIFGKTEVWLWNVYHSEQETEKVDYILRGYSTVQKMVKNWPVYNQASVGNYNSKYHFGRTEMQPRKRKWGTKLNLRYVGP